MWNHLCVFHLFCGALGPDHADLLAGVVGRREWVCFPAGAGSGVHGSVDGAELVLDGRAAFGSGARYADWAGVAFVMDSSEPAPDERPDIRFSVVRLDAEGVCVEATWDGSALRASSTDDVVYRSVRLPSGQWSTWHGAHRADVLRDPAVAVIDHRYREDWIGLDETLAEVTARRAIMGRRMVDLAGVHFHLGGAATAVWGARAAVAEGCGAVDARLAGTMTPTESDELRQVALSAFALDACGRAMGHLLKVVGGNGLRERHRFERRLRDFQAMPLHINAHEDRVVERVGRHLLGLPLDAF